MNAIKKVFLVIAIVFFGGAFIGSFLPDSRDANGVHGAVAGTSCATTWQRCVDNADLVNHWDGYSHVKSACKTETEKRVRYGDGVEWPWLAFGRFYGGDNYPKNGMVSAIEQEARITNAFNTKTRTQVTCTYDLNVGKVLSIVF